MTSPGWLPVAAARSEAEAWTVGHVLARVRARSGMDTEGLARQLGCTPYVILCLSLCRMPDRSRWQEHCRVICERFGLEPRKLEDVLLSVER